MSPPQLAADTPVADIVCPVEVSLIHTWRQKLDLPILYSLNGRLNHFIHLHKPLLLDHWLNRGMAAIVGTHIMRMGNHLNQKPHILQILHQRFPALVAVHSRILSGFFVHGCVIVDDNDLFQVMTLSNLKVIGVMGRCYLYASCPKLLIYICICNYRNLSSCSRKNKHFPNNILITLIIWVYRNRRISEQCLRTGGGNLHKTAFLPNYRVVDVPEKSILLLMLHFRIGDGSLTYRTPVYNAASLVDPTFFIQLDKYVLNGFGTALIHGKALALPVRGRSQLPELLYDASAVLFSPLPALLQELFPGQIRLVDSLLLEGFNNLNLRGDGGVVRSRLPQRIVALHSLKANQDILHGVIQSVSHVKLSGDVWRRHHNGKGLFAAVHLRVEVSLCLPFFIQTILDFLWIVGF